MPCMIALFAVGFIPASFDVPPSIAMIVEAIGMGMEAIRFAGFSSVMVRFS